jgi:quinoprotein glucose dehydrogenase
MMRMKKSFPLYGLLLLAAVGCRQVPRQVDWASYLGDKLSSQYADIDQLDVSNVDRLQVAWVYHCGGADTVRNRSQIQCNPLVIDGVLYGTTPDMQVFALAADSGTERWRFRTGYATGLTINRGLAWWEEGAERRLLAAVGPFLYALDPDTGEPILTFGNQGRVSLHDGLGDENRHKFVMANTPGIVFEDLYIVGSRVDEAWGAAPGHIRAYDVRTGSVRWVFHTIPRPGEAGYETWDDPDAWKEAGAVNAWAGLSLDESTATVFVPTGSAAYDFWGGNRTGANLFANCLLALDARTGTRRWHFQTVHHDLWDRDLPTPPNLVTVLRNGRKIPAVAQVTKSGFVFLFDRMTGTPLFPIVEEPVPPSELPGEAAWPTQPRPLAPPPLVRQSVTATDINPFSPDRDILADSIRRIRHSHMFLPPDTSPLLIFPGFDGGAEWGGAAADPDGILYVNVNEMPWVQTMLPAPPPDPAAHPGRQLYDRFCSTCHGSDLEGDQQGAYPSLKGLSDRQNRASVESLLENGRNRMPSFRQISADAMTALVDYLFGLPHAPTTKTLSDLENPIPFHADGYNRFLDSRGMPAIAPPWGTLAAVDLNQGSIRWQVPLGDWGLDAGHPTGTENYGGPVVTSGGLVFIAATRDEKIRAFDVRDGRQVWEAPLPAGGYATPATYMVDGVQYLVIACGGGKMGTPSGDAWVAFSLPQGK